MHKDGGHRHDKGDPQGLHGHEMYEMKHDERPKNIIITSATKSKKIGDKIIRTTVTTIKKRIRKVRKARKSRKR